jgi:rare lipoprotein A
MRLTFLVLLAVIGLAYEGHAFAECGIASYYHEGSRTANGERYNPDGLSAAHKSLPFGTIVRVTHRKTGRSIDLRINDRGPFVAGRIIDLSRGAKNRFGMGGLAPVCIQVVSMPARGHVQTARRKSSHRVRQHSAGLFGKSRGFIDLGFGKLFRVW